MTEIQELELKFREYSELKQKLEGKADEYIRYYLNPFKIVENSNTEAFFNFTGDFDEDWVGYVNNVWYIIVNEDTWDNLVTHLINLRNQGIIDFRDEDNIIDGCGEYYIDEVNVQIFDLYIPFERLDNWDRSSIKIRVTAETESNIEID